MAILSIAVCNNTSKIVFARQFTPMTRKELEEYIVLFSRTISQEKEVTTVETEKNRFIYYHSDPLYLVVITTKDSNVIEDMEVLKLANRLIIDLCGVGKLQESAIVEHAFDIALALDDMISFGTFEGVNMMQIKSLLLMDSAEEKEFKKIQQQREKHAREQLHIQMKEIENQRRNNTLFTDSVGSDRLDTIRCGTDSLSSVGISSVNSGIITDNCTTTKDDSKDDSKGKKVIKAKGLTLGKKKHDIIGKINNY